MAARTARGLALDNVVVGQILATPDAAGATHGLYQSACDLALVETVAAVAGKRLERGGQIGLFEQGAGRQYVATKIEFDNSARNVGDLGQGNWCP